MYYIYNTFLIKFAKKMLLLTEKLLQGRWKQKLFEWAKTTYVHSQKRADQSLDFPKILGGKFAHQAHPLPSALSK